MQADGLNVMLNALTRTHATPEKLKGQDKDPELVLTARNVVKILGCMLKKKEKYKPAVQQPVDTRSRSQW